MVHILCPDSSVQLNEASIIWMMSKEELSARFLMDGINRRLVMKVFMNTPYFIFCIVILYIFIFVQFFLENIHYGSVPQFLE
jgi:hypothetical protein